MLKGELIVDRLSHDFVLLERRRQPMRSFVRGFIDLLYVLAAQVNFNAIDITNTARNLTPSYCHNDLLIGSPGGSTGLLLRGTGPINNQQTEPDYGGEEIGIQVGSGNTAPTPSDYVMETRIAHGNGAGELLYGGCEVEPVAVSAPNATMLIRRFFTNDSGGNVTVEEVGIYSPAFTSEVVGYIFLIARDVLGAPVVVADTQLLRVQYTVSVTV